MEDENKIKENNIPNIDEVDFSKEDSIPDKIYFTEEQYTKAMTDFYNYSMSLNKQIENMMESNIDGTYNPILGQNYLQDISVYPQKPDKASLNSYLLDPARCGQQLRSIGQYLENNIMQYNRSVDYFSKILTFLYEMYPMTNIEVAKSLGEKDKYIECKEKSDNVMKKLKIKNQFRKITKTIMSEGVGFYYIKESKNSISLHQLPSTYCYITGKIDTFLTFGIDLTYFDRYKGLQNVLPELYEQYQLFTTMRDSNMPKEMVNKYQFYNVPPTIGWVFCYDTKPSMNPPLSPSFKDAFEVVSYKDMLRQKIALDTCMLLVQKIDYIKEENRFIMDLKEAAHFVASTQSLLPRGVKTIATGMKPELFSFNQSQTQSNIIGIGEKLFFDSAGISQNLFGGEAKSALTLEYSTETDFSYVEHLYHQFEDFVNFRLNNISGKYKWGVRIFGNRFKDDKRMKDIQSAVQSTNMPISPLVAYMGYEPWQFENIVAYEKELKVKEKLQPILAGSQLSSKDLEKKSGAKEKDTSDLSTSGEITRQYDSNANAQK